MPRGDKSGNSGVKPHRAGRIAEGMRRQGTTRAAANQTANAAMDREYAPRKSGNAGRAKVAFDEEAHDSRSGQRKTNLTTKEGSSKPSTARKPSSTKRDVKATGRSGKAAPARKPRTASDPATRQPSAKQSTVGTRPPRPRAPAGTKRNAT